MNIALEISKIVGENVFLILQRGCPTREIYPSMRVYRTW